MTKHNSTDADIMAKKFPKKKPTHIEGEPNMIKLLRVLPYLWNCSKSHHMTASPVGLLHIALPQTLYNLYTPTPYPNRGPHPGLIPIFAPNANDAVRERTRLEYDIALKTHKYENTMDDLLIEELLGLMDSNRTFLQSAHSQVPSCPVAGFTDSCVECL